jgi:hypothetical protein
VSDKACDTSPEVSKNSDTVSERLARTSAHPMCLQSFCGGLRLLESVSLREAVPVHQAASDLCGRWPLVRTCAANQPDFAVTLSRSRSITWVLLEFVSCAFAGCRDKSSQLGRITCWNLLAETNSCRHDESSMKLRKFGLLEGQGCCLGLISEPAGVRLAPWSVQKCVRKKPGIFCFQTLVLLSPPFFWTLPDTMFRWEKQWACPLCTRLPLTTKCFWFRNLVGDICLKTEHHCCSV